MNATHKHLPGGSQECLYTGEESADTPFYLSLYILFAKQTSPISEFKEKDVEIIHFLYTAFSLTMTTVNSGKYTIPTLQKVHIRAETICFI